MDTTQGEQGPQGERGATGSLVAVQDQLLAYRLGQVEIAVKEGFLLHDKKLTEMGTSFAKSTDLAATNIRITALENGSKKTWVWGVASFLVGAIALFLVQYALTHK